jgi:hypothetical protein
LGFGTALGFGTVFGFGRILRFGTVFTFCFFAGGGLVAVIRCGEALRRTFGSGVGPIHGGGSVPAKGSTAGVAVVAASVLFTHFFISVSRGAYNGSHAGNNDNGEPSKVCEEGLDPICESESGGVWTCPCSASSIPR